MSVVPQLELRDIAPAVFEAARRPGALDIDEVRWDRELGRTSEGPERTCLVHRDAGGAPQGYAALRAQEVWTDRRIESVAHLERFQAATPEAYIGLWSVLTSLDLMATVDAEEHAVDEALPTLLADPRAARQVSRCDFQWSRLLDPAAALSARTYESPGAVTVEVVDPAGWAAGTFTIEADAAGAGACARSGRSPEVTLPVDVLSSLWLGGGTLRLRASPAAPTSTLPARSPAWPGCSAPRGPRGRPPGSERSAQDSAGIADDTRVYAGGVEQVIPGARWARGVAVALLTAPGVVAAHALTTGGAPALLPVAVVCAVVALVACLLPTRGAGSTAAVAALAQLAGHTVLALAAPGNAPRGGCLSVVGSGAEAGVRYALADTSRGCPPGALPATPGLTAAAAAVAAALLVLLGHALLAALTAAVVVTAATGLALRPRGSRAPSARSCSCSPGCHARATSRPSPPRHPHPWPRSGGRARTSSAGLRPSSAPPDLPGRRRAPATARRTIRSPA